MAHMTPTNASAVSRCLRSNGYSAALDSGQLSVTTVEGRVAVVRGKMVKGTSLVGAAGHVLRNNGYVAEPAVIVGATPVMFVNGRLA